MPVAPQTLRILMYHAVISSPLPAPDWCFLEERDFRAQLLHLRRNYHVVPLSTAVRQLQEETLEADTVALTFDDGFQNNYEVAFPLLAEAELPATIFLTTGLIDTADTLWFCRVHHALSLTTRPSLQWDGYQFDLRGRAAKGRASRAIQERLKVFPAPGLAPVVAELVLALGDDPNRAMGIGSPYRMLSREAIRMMSARGLIEFGAHTESHAILSLLAPEQQREEIECSLDAVAEITGKPCRLFAYPNGRRDDYDAPCIRILQARGVQAGTTAMAGVNKPSTPALELRRLGVGADSSLDDFDELLRLPGDSDA